MATTVVKKPKIKKTPKNLEKPVKKGKKNEPEIFDGGIDFCGLKFPAKRKIFMIYYLTPGQPCFRNALQSALKAGYSKTTASRETYTMLRRPDIQRVIEVNDKLWHKKLHESAVRAIEIKQCRAFYDPADYFEKIEKVKVNNKGQKYTVEVIDLKDFKDMTLEQRLCIDGIDMKGQGAGTPVYMMADREKNLNDLIKMDSELSKTISSEAEEDTREIIMERITVRETKRAQRPHALKLEMVEEGIITDAEVEEED